VCLYCIRFDWSIVQCACIVSCPSIHQPSTYSSIRIHLIPIIHIFHPLLPYSLFLRVLHLIQLCVEQVASLLLYSLSTFLDFDSLTLWGSPYSLYHFPGYSSFYNLFRLCLEAELVAKSVCCGYRRIHACVYSIRITACMSTPTPGMFRNGTELGCNIIIIILNIVLAAVGSLPQSPPTDSLLWN
jgi:hypothetical protein